MEISQLFIKPAEATGETFTIRPRQTCDAVGIENVGIIDWTTTDLDGFVLKVEFDPEIYSRFEDDFEAIPKFTPIGSAYQVELPNVASPDVLQELTAAFEMYKIQYCTMIN